MRKGYENGWKEGFTAGYQKALADHALEHPHDHALALALGDVFTVTEEKRSEFPGLGLPVGNRVRIIRDLANNPIAYQQIGQTESYND